MAVSTKNEMLSEVETVIDILSKPDGTSALPVLLANRAAIVILHRMATELAIGAYERSKQERRKIRRLSDLVPGQAELEFEL